MEPDPEALHLDLGPEPSLFLLSLSLSHWLAVGSPVSPSLDFQLMSLMVQDHVEKGQDTTSSGYLGKGEDQHSAGRLHDVG